MSNTHQNDSTTLILNKRIITDYAVGDLITNTPVNAPTFRVNTKKSVIVGNRSDAGVHDMVIRIVKFSPDHKWLNNARNQATPVLFSGSLKELYNEDGVDKVSSWKLEDGSITAVSADTRNDIEGNAILEYTLQFRNATDLS